MSTTEDIRLNKKFAYTVAIVLLAIAGYHLLVKHSYDSILLGIALGLLLLSIIKAIWLSPLRLIWDKIGYLLGVMNTYILLILFYFLILTPLGLVMRLLGKDMLKLKYLKNQPTYWENSPQKLDSNMTDQF